MMVSRWVVMEISQRCKIHRSFCVFRSYWLICSYYADSGGHYSASSRILAKIPAKSGPNCLSAMRVIHTGSIVVALVLLRFSSSTVYGYTSTHHRLVQPQLHKLKANIRLAHHNEPWEPLPQHCAMPEAQVKLGQRYFLQNPQPIDSV